MNYCDQGKGGVDNVELAQWPPGERTVWNDPQGRNMLVWLEPMPVVRCPRLKSIFL